MESSPKNTKGLIELRWTISLTDTKINRNSDKYCEASDLTG